MPFIIATSSRPSLLALYGLGFYVPMFCKGTSHRQSLVLLIYLLIYFNLSDADCVLIG